MLDLTSSISTVSKKKGNVRYASRTSIAGDAFQRFRLTPLLSHHVGMMVLAKSRRQSEAVALWFGQWAFYVETLYLLLSKKPRSDCAVSKGGRGKVNPTRQKAIAEGKKANIGERTMQAAVAKAEGRKPKKKPWRRTPVHSGLDAARRAYFKWCIDLDADLDAELDIIREAFREIAGRGRWTRIRRRPQARASGCPSQAFAAHRRTSRGTRRRPDAPCISRAIWRSWLTPKRPPQNDDADHDPGYEDCGHDRTSLFNSAMSLARRIRETPGVGCSIRCENRR
jgi:hypothetical protein